MRNATWTWRFAIEILCTVVYLRLSRVEAFVCLFVCLYFRRGRGRLREGGGRIFKIGQVQELNHH